MLKSNRDPTQRYKVIEKLTYAGDEIHSKNYTRPVIAEFRGQLINCRCVSQLICYVRDTMQHFQPRRTMTQKQLKYLYLQILHKEVLQNKKLTPNITFNEVHFQVLPPPGPLCSVMISGMIVVIFDKCNPHLLKFIRHYNKSVSEDKYSAISSLKRIIYLL